MGGPEGSATPLKPVLATALEAAQGKAPVPKQKVTASESLSICMHDSLWVYAFQCVCMHMNVCVCVCGWVGGYLSVFVCVCWVGGVFEFVWVCFPH